MYKLRQKLFSQNFLYNRELVAKLIRGSSLSKKDLILEIGPGKGILTEALIKQSQHVIAVEIDAHWYTYLQNKFTQAKNLTLYNQDFLDFKLPSLPYKVFANIPFSIEGIIIRKLLDGENPPDDTYVVMMKGLAYRLAAPYKENMFSIMHKPWFQFSIYHTFKRSDFLPIPRVDAVMLRVRKRSDPLISWKDRETYEACIKIGFGQGQPVYQHLKKHYEYKRMAKVLQHVGVKKNIKPSYITLNQWITLYHLLKFPNYE